MARETILSFGDKFLWQIRLRESQRGLRKEQFDSICGLLLQQDRVSTLLSADLSDQFGDVGVGSCDQAAH